MIMTAVTIKSCTQPFEETGGDPRDWMGYVEVPKERNVELFP
jgi:hypothetical protein